MFWIFMSGHDNLLINTFISEIIVLSMVVTATLISSEIRVPKLTIDEVLLNFV